MGDYTDDIQRLYVAYFNRPADPAGLITFNQELNDRLAGAPATLADLVELAEDFFSLSPEYLATITDSEGNKLPDTEIINNLYVNLFNRQAEADGILDWVAQLADGSQTIASIAVQLTFSAQGTDADTIEVKLDAANAFTENVDTTEELIGYNGMAAATAAADWLAQFDFTNPATDDDVQEGVAAVTAAGNGSGGQTLTLTSGTDTLVGGLDGDLFDAGIVQNPTAGGVSNSLSSADDLNGSAGIDTLMAELTREFVGDNSLVVNEIDVQPSTTSIENVLFEARDDLPGLVGLPITVDAKDMTGVNEIGSYYSDGDLVIENLTTLTDNGAIRLTQDMTITMEYTDDFDSDEDASDLTVLFDEDYLNTSTDAAGSQLDIRVVNAVTNVVGENPIFGTDSFTFSIDGDEITINVEAIAADDTLDFSTAYQAIVNLINTQLAATYPTVTAALGPLRPAVFSIDIAANGTTYEPGDSAGSYFPIVITNTGPEVLTTGGFTQAQVEDATDINSSQTDTPPEEFDQPIRINIDLEKVGRDGEGGNLIVGAKGQDILFEDSDEDQNDGIEVFDITVYGDEDKPSNLGFITSTNNFLETVNIVSEDRTDGEYASLTVRGVGTAPFPGLFGGLGGGFGSASPFGPAVVGGGSSVTDINANGFFGDLTVGLNFASAQVNATTFSATGGGDITYWASYFDPTDGTPGFPSLLPNTFTNTFGSGDDINALSITDGAQVFSFMGGGDDTVIAQLGGEDDSTSDGSNLTVTATGGDNSVTISQVGGRPTGPTDPLNVNTFVVNNHADVTLSSGDDVVLGGAVDLTAWTAAGDDLIVVDNTGSNPNDPTPIAGLGPVASSPFTQLFAPSGTTELVTTTIAASGTGGGGPYTVPEVYLGFGRTLRITLDVPEGTGGTENIALQYARGFEVIVDQSSAGFITTELELYTTIANAINSDPVLSKLAVATIDSLGSLTITYLIDGVSTNVDGMLLVEIVDPDNPAGAASAATWDDLSSSEQSALTAAFQDLFNDSAITAADVEAAYESVTTTADIDVVEAGADSTAANINVVNPGADDDVVVLSSNSVNVGATGPIPGPGIFDVVVFDAAPIGHNTIVHFDAAQNLPGTAAAQQFALGGTPVVPDGDLLDFQSHLINVVSNSGSSTSQDRILTSLVAPTAMTANSVSIIDFNTVETSSPAVTDIDFRSLTDAQVLAAVNADAAFGSTIAAATDAVGSTLYHVLLIEYVGDTSPAAGNPTDNAGEYLVVLLTSDKDDSVGGATDEFTSATIIGSIDFGETRTAGPLNNLTTGSFAGAYVEQYWI